MSSIKIGDTGTSVVLLQGILQKLQFPVAADGIFGPCTEKAVKEFQEDCEIESDGKVGEETASQLVRSLHFTDEDDDDMV